MLSPRRVPTAQFSSQSEAFLCDLSMSGSLTTENRSARRKDSCQLFALPILIGPIPPILSRPSWRLVSAHYSFFSKFFKRWPAHPLPRAQFCIGGISLGAFSGFSVAAIAILLENDSRREGSLPRVCGPFGGCEFPFSPCRLLGDQVFSSPT